MSSRGKKLLLVILLSSLVFVGLAGYGDFREVWRHLAEFPPGYLFLALGLAVVNYLLRFLRWAYYLKLLGISVPFSVSSLTFLTGLAMTITPGKVGELVKSYLLRDRAGAPVTASLPVVLMERLTDLISVALMGFVGLMLLPPLVSAGLGIVVVTVAVVVYFLTTRHTDRLMSLPVVRRWSEQLQEARQGMRELSRPMPLVIAVALGLLSWVSEGVALWVVLQGLGADVGLLLSLPIYAGSVIVGAVTTLPGGLVGTEGAMVTLLQQAGVARDAAAAGTLLVRVATLWFAVGVGLAALAWLHWLLPGPRVSQEPVVEPGISEPIASYAGEGRENE